MRRTRLLPLVAVSLLVPCFVSAPLAAKTVQRTLKTEGRLPDGGALAVENLLGAIRLDPSLDPGVFRIEAEVIAEAKEQAEAQALADSIELRQTEASGQTTIHVVFPVDRHTDFRPPKGGVGGWLSRWTDSVLRGDPLAVEYGGRQVRVGHERKATGLAVHLRLWLPLDARTTLTQTAGLISGRALRGDIHVNTVVANVELAASYGAFHIRTEAGDVTVASFQGETLDVRTGRGEIAVQEVRAERVSLETDSGPVRGAELDAQVLRIVTQKGQIKLGGVEPVTAEVRSVSGGVDLATHFERTRSAEIEAVDGDVTLRVGKLTYFDLLAETKSGAVKTLGVTLESVGQEDGATHLKHGAGGARIQVRAHAGSVTVRPYDASRLDILVGDTDY